MLIFKGIFKSQSLVQPQTKPICGKWSYIDSLVMRFSLKNMLSLVTMPHQTSLYVCVHILHEWSCAGVSLYHASLPCHPRDLWCHLSPSDDIRRRQSRFWSTFGESHAPQFSMFASVHRNYSMRCILEPCKLCSYFGYCRRRLFSPEKGGPNLLGHVQIEKSVFLLVFYVFYVLFNELSSFVPTLDIAAGAFFPQQ